MKSIIKGSLVFGIGLLASAMAFADQYTARIVLDDLKIENTGDVIVVPSTVINPAGCTDPSGYYLPASHVAYDTYMSFLLSAFHAGGDVILSIDGTTCVSNNPEIVRVLLRK